MEHDFTVTVFNTSMQLVDADCRQFSRFWHRGSFPLRASSADSLPAVLLMLEWLLKPLCRYA